MTNIELVLNKAHTILVTKVYMSITTAIEIKHTHFPSNSLLHVGGLPDQRPTQRVPEASQTLLETPTRM